MGLNKRLIDQAGGAAGVTNTDNFAPVLYTGNGGTQSITSLDFQPDLVWIKNRDTTEHNILIDVIRQNDTGKFLSSNLTGAPFNTTQPTFNSSGFTLDGIYNGYLNISNNDYVAWCFKGGGTAVSNTDGTITSTVSANQDAGFSIVAYTGSASANQTVGHGLSQTPELIIVKNRDTSGNSWAVQSSAIGGADWHMILNSTQARQNNVDWIWNDTEPTSTVFTVGQFGLTNQSPDKFIAYCFHSVDGYQKIGSYTSSYPSTTSVNVGFQPRFVMIKSYNQARNWVIHDSARTDDKQLYPNLTNTEADTGTQLQFTSTGFDVSGGSNDLDGGSSYSYIYLAIA